MDNGLESHDAYFQHLQEISLSGRLYKKYYMSRVLYFWARRFGSRILEVGAGAGHGVLGAYSSVSGLDINPLAVDYCKAKSLNADLINPDGTFPISDASVNACIMDNVLEHIIEPTQTLNECFRVTTSGGGLIIAVPGRKGYDSDPDHKIFYDEKALRTLDNRWKLLRVFSTPFIFINESASDSVRQYCLIAVYRRGDSGARSQARS